MKQSKLLLGYVVFLIFVIVAGVLIWFVWLPQLKRSAFEDHYLNIMKNVNSTESKTGVIGWFERDYNFTELYEWVNEKLEFIPVNETFERNTDPAKILESGKGRCEEFSILYVAACLAHGYQSRIIVSIDVSNPINLIGQHVWAEVKMEGWVHVDPSDQIWNDPYRYEAWSWGEGIGSNIKIYAFEEDKYEDVTLNYKSEVEEVTTMSYDLMSLLVGALIASIPSIILFAITEISRRAERRESHEQRKIDMAHEFYRKTYDFFAPFLSISSDILLALDVIKSKYSRKKIPQNILLGLKKVSEDLLEARNIFTQKGYTELVPRTLSNNIEDVAVHLGMTIDILEKKERISRLTPSERKKVLNDLIMHCKGLRDRIRRLLKVDALDLE